MNRLWVRLSLAFSAVIVMAGIASFTVLFVTSWVIPQPQMMIDELALHYEDSVGTYVEHSIIEGQSNEQIIAEVQDLHDEILSQIILEKRIDGFAKGVDVQDRSLERILSDFVYELVTPDLLQWVVLSGLIGMITGIWMSRTLTAPLNRLAEAARALGKHDLSQRVTVQGSQEISELGETFNQMAEQLEHAEQLRQNLLADVSHELRTPLTALEGSLRAALDQVYDLDGERLARLYTQTRHLTRLVEDLRIVAQAEARRLPLHLERIDIHRIITETLEIFSYPAEESNITLTSKLPAHLPPIEADEGRIRQVLHNLLANALRHTPTGGTITISAQPQAKNLQISITDSGEGISAEHLPHLFDRFYRTDKARSRDKGGTGLGLAIVKAIVEAHSGQVSAKSDGIKRGSTFTIELPSS